ncbi:hypothetical protein BU17DRAFT_67129 [Hysterangium stoloniferum]|nr:hypothetical protein BU17DRAFT_67129 [Hysterangium stoloniferum]
MCSLILQLRLFAIYDGNRILVIVIGLLFLLEILATISIVGIAIVTPLIAVIPLPANWNVTSIPLHLLSGCYDGLQSEDEFLFYAMWIPSLIFETILCLLALFKSSSVEFDGNGIISGKGCSPHPYSILYFLAIFFTLLANCLTWALCPPVNGEAGLGLTVAISCAMGSRMMLNMRKVYFNGDSETTGRATNTMKTLQFTHQKDTR